MNFVGVYRIRPVETYNPPQKPKPNVGAHLRVCPCFGFCKYRRICKTPILLFIF